MRKPKHLVLALTWTIVVTFLSLAKVEGLETTITIPNKDKMVHFVFYFLFYVVWYIYITSKNEKPKLPLIILASSIGYGILMEGLQGVIGNNRTPDLMDVLANSVGALCGHLLMVYFLSKKKQI